MKTYLPPARRRGFGASWLAPAAEARAAWPPRAGAKFELPARPDTLLELGREGGWVVAVRQNRRSVLAVRPAAPSA